MHDEIDGVFEPPATEKQVDDLSTSLGLSLPRDYLDFLRRHDGAGFFTKDHYVIIWKAEEVPRSNQDLNVETLAPGILLFGSNGAAEAFGFDMRQDGWPIVMVPMIGMSREDALPVAGRLNDILEQACRKKSS